MLKYHLGDWPRKFIGFQYVVTYLRVRFDQFEFDLSYAAWFAQDLSRYRYFTEIMNYSAHADAINLIVRKTHFFGNGAGKIRHTLLMTCRIWVPCFDSACYGQDTAFQGLSKFFHAIL